MARTLDGDDQLPLMAGAGAGDTLRNDAALFRNASLEPLLVLVIDVIFFRIAKPAGALLPLLLIPAASAGTATARTTTTRSAGSGTRCGSTTLTKWGHGRYPFISSSEFGIGSDHSLFAGASAAGASAGMGVEVIAGLMRLSPVRRDFNATLSRPITMNRSTFSSRWK